MAVPAPSTGATPRHPATPGRSRWCRWTSPLWMRCQARMADPVRAAVQTGARAIEIREFPRPVCGPDDGLLRIEACGVCGSDVEQYKGNLGRAIFPLVPGHEPLGIIEEVGKRAAARWDVSPGDRVALEILVPCRSCDLCLTGRYMSCRNRHGSYGYTPCTV